METQDGGDAKVEVSPRDIIYTQPAEPLEGEQPRVLHKLDLRYGYENELDDLFLFLFGCLDSLFSEFESGTRFQELRLQTFLRITLLMLLSLMWKPSFLYIEHSTALVTLPAIVLLPFILKPFQCDVT